MLIYYNSLLNEFGELPPASNDEVDIAQLIDAVESLSNDPAFVSTLTSSSDLDNFPNLEPLTVPQEEPPREPIVNPPIPSPNITPTPAPLQISDPHVNLHPPAPQIEAKPSATATIQINPNVLTNTSAIHVAAAPNQVMLPKVAQNTQNSVIQGQQIIINGANLNNIPLQQINIASLLPNKTMTVRPQQNVQTGTGGNIIVRAIQPNIILQPQQVTQVLLAPNSSSSPQNPQQLILAPQPVSNCPPNTQPIVVEPQNTNINLINVGNLNLQGYNLQSVSSMQPNVSAPRQPLQIVANNVANNGVTVPIRSQLQDHLGLKQKLIVVSSAPQPQTSSITVRCIPSGPSPSLSSTLASARNIIPQTSQPLNSMSSTSTDPNLVRVVPCNDRNIEQQQFNTNQFQNTGHEQPSGQAQHQIPTVAGSSSFSKPQLEKIINHLKTEINILASKQSLAADEETKLSALREAHEALKNNINDSSRTQPQTRPVAQVPPNVTITQASPFSQKPPLLQDANRRIQQSTRPVNIVPANNVCTSQPVKTEPVTITIQKGTATHGVEANQIKFVNNKLILPPALEEKIKRLPEDKQMKIYKHFISQAQNQIRSATNFQNANVTLSADLGATNITKKPIVSASATNNKPFATPTQPVKKTTVQATTPVQMAQNQLLNDHKFALNPEIKEPFKDIKDVCRRLVRYHVFQHRMPQKEVLDYGNNFSKAILNIKYSFVLYRIQMMNVLKGLVKS